MNIDSIFKRLIQVATLALMVGAGVLGVSFYRVTLPKINAEVDETHRASVELALTAMEARKFAKAENAALPVTQAKVNATLDSVNTLLVKAGTTIDSINQSQSNITFSTVVAMRDLDESIKALPPVLDATKKSIEGLQPVEDASAKTITKLGATSDAVTDAVAAPEIKATEKNIQSASGSLADTAEEGHQYVHNILHPKWPAVVGDWIERIVVDVGKMIL